MRVLSITHGRTVPGGVFDEVVEARGDELERWVVPLGGAPRAAERYDAIMVFGGSMHPDEDERFPWLESEATFLVDALERRIPTIGVCLGAQMLARAAGAAVSPAPEPEVGWLELELTPAGAADPVLGALSSPSEAFQWHRYTFEIPPGGVELARSRVCTQAFRLECAWGLQFHAEVTQPMIEAWLQEDADDVEDPAALRTETVARIEAWNAIGRSLCDSFLDTTPGGRSA